MSRLHSSPAESPFPNRSREQEEHLSVPREILSASHIILIPCPLRSVASSKFRIHQMIRYPYTGAGLEGFQLVGTVIPRTSIAALFRSMLRIRRIEEEIERRYHEDQMKTPIHLVIGQEATSVGVLRRARPARSPLFQPPDARQLPGQGRRPEARCCARCTAASTAASGSRGGSMHLIDKRVGMAGTSAIVGGAVPIATGAALAAQMKGEDHVVVVFLGDADHRRRRRCRRA